MTYSHMGEPHYHWRYDVSLLSSGRDQVGPSRYCRQQRGLDMSLLFLLFDYKCLVYGRSTCNLTESRLKVISKYSFLFYSLGYTRQINQTCIQTTWVLYGQAKRAISTGQLHASLRFHTLPINVLVLNGSLGKSNLEVGFPLRCFQRLSHPNVATGQCHWRDNPNTRGSSTPVLSYQEQLLSNLQRPRQIGTELSHDVLNPARVPL